MSVECGAVVVETDANGTYGWECTLVTGHPGRHEAWGFISDEDPGPYYVWEADK